MPAAAPLKSRKTLRFSEIDFLHSIEMAREIDRIAVGTRFKMSKLGAARCPELANQTGVVVEVGHRTTGVTVLFDGAKRPTCLHRDFVSPVSAN